MAGREDVAVVPSLETDTRQPESVDCSEHVTGTRTGSTRDRHSSAISCYDHIHREGTAHGGSRRCRTE